MTLGPLAWLVPPAVLAVWLFSPPRAIVADAWRIGALFVLVGSLSAALILAAGMRAVGSSCVAAAALHLAVLAPMVIAGRLARSAVATRTRRGWVLALVGHLLPAAVGLPLLMLSNTVHRAQGTLSIDELGLPWPHQRVDFRGADGTPLVGLWFENPAARGAVMLVHGLGAEKVQALPAVEELYRRGYHVLAYDQRNHGESGGLTTTLGILEAEDAARAWRLLRERTAGQRIPRVLFGVSAGGAAAQLAAPHLPGLDGLVLDSTFADLGRVAQRGIPVPLLAAVALAIGRAADGPLVGHDVLDLEPSDAAAGLSAGIPVLVLHARADPLVPFSEGEAVARAYGSRARLVELEGEHHANGFAFDAARYDAALAAFVERLGESQRPRRSRPPAPGSARDLEWRRG